MRRMGGYFARRLDTVLLVAALVASGIFVCECARGHLKPLNFQDRMAAEPDDYVPRRESNISAGSDGLPIRRYATDH
jgi:hypothetical protein